MGEYLDVETVQEKNAWFRRFTHVLLSWYFFGFLALLISLACQWFYQSTLFSLPADVENGRKEYLAARTSFEELKHYWTSKAAQYETSINQALAAHQYQSVIDTLNTLPLEVLIALTADKIPNHSKQITQLSFSTKSGLRTFPLLLSKYEKEAWPLHVLLALDAEISVSNNRFQLRWIRLRRGSQDISIALSNFYFGTEIAPLYQLLPIDPIL